MIVSRHLQGMDPYQVYLNVGPESMIEARRQRQYARHHNGITVGTVALGVSSEGEIMIATGANQNLRPGRNHTKVCAEQVAVQKMLDKGFNRLIGLWVSGPPQPDTQSGHVGGTLCTCGECRAVLSGAEDVIGYDEALFTSVHPARDEYEVYTGSEQTLLHTSPKVVSINHHRDKGFKRWQRGARLYAKYSEHPENYPPVKPSEAVIMAIGGRLLPDAA